MPLPKTPKVKVPPLGGVNTSTQRTRIGDTGFDPRFDERVKEQQRLNDLTTTVERRSAQDTPSLYLPDYEGHGFVSSMSDRTAAGGTLTGINDVQLKSPINLRGGQDYMFENPGQVWASAEDPVRAIMMQAAAAKALTGKDPLMMNWRMAPTGGDFAHMTGETMLSFAESNMGKGTKRSLDKEIKQFIPDWKGIDSPDSIAQYRELPDAARKALKAAMDKTFRNEGGLGIGEARLSVADPQQLNAPEGYLMNVGRIFADKPIIEHSGHPSYPKGVPGEGIGRIADDRSLFELNPKVFPPERDIRSLLADPSTARSAYENLPDVVTARGIPDPREPRQSDTRALQMKPYYGILTEDILRGMGYAQGGMVDSAPEEAIKNTITDPQAYKMLDMDLANLALMNQPQRMMGGGAVHMEDGGGISLSDLERDRNPFSVYSKPTYQPEVPIVDSAGNIIPAARQSAPDLDTDYMRYALALGKMAKDQAIKEAQSMTEPRAVTDVLNRGLIAGTLGAPVDLINMGLMGVDYLSGKLNPQGKQLGLSSDKPVLGSEYIQDLMRNANMTSDTERPILELAANFIPPKLVTGAVRGAAKAVEKSTPFAKSAAEMANEMYMAGKVPGMVAPNVYMASPSTAIEKTLAPASDLGFYSPAESVALNLQRKSGQGQAFLNDLKKGGVNNDEIEFTGLGDFLRSKPTVTADEVKDYISKNKIDVTETRLGDKQSYDANRLKQLENEFRNLSEHPIDAPNFGQEKYNELMKLQNIRDNITVEDLYTKAERAQQYGVESQRKGEKELADAYFREHELLNSRAEALALQDLGPSNPTKYGGYKLPGGDNYRELLLTMPDKKTSALKPMERPKVIASGVDESGRGQFDVVIDGKSVERFNTWPEAQNHALELEESENIRRYIESQKNPSYKSSHFNEPNILSHMRVQDFTDAQGKKMLLVDEVQSDWHQAGKKGGYKLPPETTAEMDSEYRSLVHKNADLIKQGLTPLPQDVKRAKLLEDQLIRSDASTIPNAPFKDTWHELTLKRAIKEAVDNGYDRVGLTTGARQNERYNLNKFVDRIDYNKNENGTYNLYGIKDRGEVISKANIDEKELSSLVGRDVAKRITEGQGNPQSDHTGIDVVRSLSGLDLEVGGKGMKTYYDEIYPSFLKKFAKKYDAGFGETTLPSSNGEPVRYMDITPSMRAAVKKGLPYKHGGKVSFANTLDAMRHELTKAK